MRVLVCAIIHDQQANLPTTHTHTHTQALCNLACAPELVLPLLLSLGRLNSMASHLVASHSSDMATKATFTHALLNASLHRCVCVCVCVCVRAQFNCSQRKFYCS